MSVLRALWGWLSMTDLERRRRGAILRAGRSERRLVPPTPEQENESEAK